MTLIITIVLGFGVILILSSLDDTPVISTFRKILSGKPLDLSGKGADDKIKG